MNLRHALITPAFAEQHSSRRRMGEDMTTNRLAAIGSCKERTGARVTLDLIRLKQIRN